MAERALILYTFSKKYAMTGWRLGAAVGPVNQINALALLNVNDESCTNHFVQYAGLEALTGPQDGARAILTELNKRRDRCHELVNQIPHVHCARPDTTFYLYPNVTWVMALQHEQDYESFRRNVLQETGVSFCTRIHFGKPLSGERERYIRLSYAGINVERIEEGLAQLRVFVERLLDHGKRENHEYIHHS
jgi:aspartate/methionine/tyrosine aminotransferase